MTAITYDPTSRSNVRHDQQFVIQGFDTAAGQWMDSKHGSQTPDQTLQLAAEIGATIAMPGTKLRIVPSK
jgi:hypothetical protein